MGTRRSILIYCQHLSGAGHFVRCREIARVLAPHHDVWFVTGGREIPSRPLDSRIHLVCLPRLYREARAIVPVESGRSLAEVFEERSRALQDLVREVRPEVLLIEHFPMSKWELKPEILSLIAFAKAVRPDVRVVSSVRDHPEGSDGRSSPERYEIETVQTLNEYFDALLVHSDPKIVRLETQFPWLSEVRIPIHHTGYVSEPLTDSPQPNGEVACDISRGYVLVSSGGLPDGLRLAELSRNAWGRLESSGQTHGKRMVIFAGLFADESAYSRFAQSVADGPFCLRRFDSDFTSWMTGAELSISQAGYNTTMNVLQSRTRAILAPNRRTADQPRRAKLFQELGLVHSVDPETLNEEQLAGVMEEALSKPRPVHEIALDGAEGTREILESI